VLDPIDELVALDAALKKELLAVMTDVGEIQDVEPPQSAFVALAAVLDVLEDNDAEWRVAIRGLKSDTQVPRAGKSEYVRVLLDLTFFAPTPVEASDHYAAFRAAVQANPWCISCEFKSVRGAQEAGGEGEAIIVDGLVVEVDVTKYFDNRS
jgi:hypothetical protein